MPMLIWTLQNTKQYSPAAHHGSFLSHTCRHVGKLPGSYSSTVSVSVGWMCLHTVLVDNFHSRPFLSSLLFSGWSCKSRMWVCQYTGICEAFQGIHGSQEPECDKCGVNDILLFRTRGPLSQSMQGSLRLTPITDMWLYWYLLYMNVCMLNTEDFSHFILKKMHKIHKITLKLGSWYIYSNAKN